MCGHLTRSRTVRDPDHRAAIKVIENLHPYVITNDCCKSSPGIAVRIESIRAADQAQKCRLKKIVLGAMRTATPVRVRKINRERPMPAHQLIARDQVAAVCRRPSTTSSSQVSMSLSRHYLSQPLQCRSLHGEHRLSAQASLASDGSHRFLGPAVQPEMPAKHFRLPGRESLQSRSQSLKGFGV